MNKLKIKLINLYRSQSGVVLITVLMVALLVSFVGISLAELSISQLLRTKRNVSVSNSLLVAEAGIESTIREINTDNGYSPPAGEQTFFNTLDQGCGTYLSTIEAGTSGNERILKSTGRVYRYNSCGDIDNLISERKVKVTIVGTASVDYGVYTGPGGLILRGGTDIINADVYVNGYINIVGNSQIGTFDNPVEVNVGNRQCPSGSNPGPTYPSVCGAGVEPITTSGGGSIYGTVCATGQVDDSSIFEGATGAGLIPGCTAPLVSTPSYNYATHVAAMTNVGAPNSSSIRCNGTQSWAANLRITGTMNLTSGSCDLTINGDVHIQGNFAMERNGGKMRVAEGLTERPVIVVDGTVNSRQGFAILPNSAGIGVEIISYRSTAACDPGCEDGEVTGTDLYNSQSTTVMDLRATGGSPGSVFHAYWGKVNIGAQGIVGSAIGQTVELSGGGNVIFGLSLSSGTSTWTIRSYQYDFD
jgi:hypothetical protein